MSQNVKELMLECGIMLAILLASLLACLAVSDMPSKAEWDGQRFVCPARTSMWVSESEALAGKQDYVYCVR